jgi:hypothetical protein
LILGGKKNLGKHLFPICPWFLKKISKNKKRERKDKGAGEETKAH